MADSLEIKGRRMKCLVGTQAGRQASRSQALHYLACRQPTMRLWSVHPRFLDQKGLVACWREGLLAQKVLTGTTKGYTKHPQLSRWSAYAQPLVAIGLYLHLLQMEATNRGYNFNPGLILHPPSPSSPLLTPLLPSTSGSLLTPSTPASATLSSLTVEMDAEAGRGGSSTVTATVTDMINPTTTTTTTTRTVFTSPILKVTAGQLAYELDHLKRKLRVRDKAAWKLLTSALKEGDAASLLPHPMFEVVQGEVEVWERVAEASALKKKTKAQQQAEKEKGEGAKRRGRSGGEKGQTQDVTAASRGRRKKATDEQDDTMQVAVEVGVKVRSTTRRRVQAVGPAIAESGEPVGDPLGESGGALGGAESKGVGGRKRKRARGSAF